MIKKKGPLFHLIVLAKRIIRLTGWYLRGRYAKRQQMEILPHSVKTIQVAIDRPGTDLHIHNNKIHNLQLAAKALDGIVVRPRETFSFWRTLGMPTGWRGYKESTLLSQGEIVKGMGGGLEHMANQLYWLVLHSPLTVTERHPHEFDHPVQDVFGRDADVVYNYQDFQFKNLTPFTFQINISVTARSIKLQLLSSDWVPTGYNVFERNHRYSRRGETNFRQNEIWRQIIDKRTGGILAEELVTRNCAQVNYPLEDNFESLG